MTAFRTFLNERGANQSLASRAITLFQRYGEAKLRTLTRKELTDLEQVGEQTADLWLEFFAATPERFISPEPLPGPEHQHMLTIFMEECLEAGLIRAAIRASKIKRFGVAEVEPGKIRNNSQRLAHEIGDILAVVEHLYDLGVIDRHEVRIGQEQKERQLEKFVQEGGEPT